MGTIAPDVTERTGRGRSPLDAGTDIVAPRPKPGCRFCGCAIRDEAVVVDTAAGSAHESCVDADAQQQVDGGAWRMSAIDAVSKIARGTGLNGR